MRERERERERAMRVACMVVTRLQLNQGVVAR